MKIQSMFFLAGYLFAASSPVFSSEPPDAVWVLDHEDMILALPPEEISEEQFYAYEHGILLGYSGSAGYFLKQEHVDWLLKMESRFASQGVHLRDDHDRLLVIANSYENRGEFEQAIAYYRKAKMPLEAAAAEWRLNNQDFSGGPLKLIDYDGQIPDLENAQVVEENEQYLFASFLKGPVVRYEKQAARWAVVFVPDQYEWADKLELDQSGLEIQLRLDSGIYKFDNEKRTIERVAAENVPGRGSGDGHESLAG